MSGYALTGREWDAETNLYYYRARYYDPSGGRFISEDPIRFQGGINLYAYANDNPVRFLDPWGLAPCDTMQYVSCIIQCGRAGVKSCFYPPGCVCNEPGDPGYLPPRDPDPVYPPPTIPPIVPPLCDDQCKQKTAAAGAAAVTAYIAYRCIRMVPSLYPPLWWTIPGNATAP